MKKWNIYIYKKEKNKEIIIIKKITILKKKKKIKRNIEIHCAWKNIKDTK